jgi:hypothetical protein
LDDETSFPEAPGTRETNPFTDGKSMKAAPFDSTPEFKHFKEVMRHVLAVPKTRLDELVREAKETSPRNGDPNAPGQKRAKRRISKKPRK